jgi:predicted nucleotidyltransferase component of viral defense system
MVTIDLHRNILIKLLRDIYADPDLRTVLGFKGGTAAMLFYGLPRFSADLDFDLLDIVKKTVVFEKVKAILHPYGTVSEEIEKKYTLFYLLQYQKGERNLKLEISKRSDGRDAYSPKNYLGISMLVMNEPEMAAGKLSALLTRNTFAARDMFDLWYFLKNNWKIAEPIVEAKTGIDLAHAFIKAQDRVAAVTKSELLSGLGDLLDVKQRMWVREHLMNDLLFLLRLYEDNLVKIQRGSLS